MSLADLVDNDPGVEPGTRFCAILGANPSKGARSPALWNAAFGAHGLATRMVPLDVPDDRLVAVLDLLDADADFQGGAIAVPHKLPVAAWATGRLQGTAAGSGAVNCLYRGPDGRLWGANTDGDGALASLRDAGADVAGRTVLVLGSGGVAAAVTAAALAGEDPPRRVVVAARHPERAAALAGIGAEVVAWDGLDTVLPTADVVVQATPVGSTGAGSVGQSPLDGAQLGRLPADGWVFDAVYDPSPTALLQAAADRGLRTLDGSGMNLEQAVIGFGLAAPDLGAGEVTRRAMEHARRALG